MYEDNVGYFYIELGDNIVTFCNTVEKINQVVEICYIVYSAYHECTVGGKIQPTRAVR